MRFHVRTLSVTALMLVLGLLVSACAGQPAADPAKLKGSWKLEAFGAAKGTEAANVAVNTEITFGKGEVTGNGGVNGYSAPYDAPGGNALTFGPVTATRMAGPEPAMTQESRFFEALAKTKHFEFNGEKLILTSNNNDTIAVLAPK